MRVLMKGFAIAVTHVRPHLHGSSDGWGSGSRHELFCHPGRVCKGLLERVLLVLYESGECQKLIPYPLGNVGFGQEEQFLEVLKRSAPVLVSLLNLDDTQKTALRLGRQAVQSDMTEFLVPACFFNCSFPSSLRQVRFVGWVAGTPSDYFCHFHAGYTFFWIFRSRGPWCHGFCVFLTTLSAGSLLCDHFVLVLILSNTRLGEVSARQTELHVSC